MSEKRVLKFPGSKQTHFKIWPIGFRNAELGQWMCSVWAESKHWWAIYLQIVKSFSIVHQVLVVMSLTLKFGLLSEALDFTYSALEYQQSGFWWWFQYLTCTLSIIQLSNNVICQDMHSLGVNQDSCLGWKSFSSLWRLCCPLYGWEQCQILPIAPVKIIHKSRISETYP